MWPRSRPRLLALLGLVPACQSPQADTSPFTTTPPATSAPASSETGSTGSDSTSSGTSTGGTSDNNSTHAALSTSSTGSDPGSTTVVFDLGTDEDIGDGKPPGCKGKIDFLFVISRWGGMKYFQDQLLGAFPKFVETIESKFADFDYHIMVIDADPEWGLSTCDEQCPTPGEGLCTVKDYPCDYMPSVCDTTMGAGVVFPAGGQASNKLCKIDGGRRYMAKGQTELEKTFACVAQLGMSGDAKVGEALAAAMQPAINGPRGCNAGFIRKDALLMVTLMSNTYDEDGAPTGSKGSPVTWTAAVRKAKLDDLYSVVLLNIGDTTVPGCDKLDRLCQMVPMFPYAMNREFTEDKYAEYFDEATELVETACAEFVPPG